MDPTHEPLPLLCVGFKDSGGTPYWARSALRIDSMTSTHDESELQLPVGTLVGIGVSVGGNTIGVAVGRGVSVGGTGAGVSVGTVSTGVAVASGVLVGADVGRAGAGVGDDGGGGACGGAGRVAVGVGTGVAVGG